MWQRIQTLYLAIAAALLAAMLWSAKAVIALPGGESECVRFTTYIPYLVLIIISLLLELLALTTFKHRGFQLRTAVLASLILLGLQGWLVVDFLETRQAMAFRPAAVFPLVSIILNVLAIRGIWVDEMLVRSASRLRSSRRKK